MNSEKPTPSQLPTNTASAAATAAALGGTPLSILSIMLWQSYHTGHPLTAIEASAVGSIGAAVFAYFWHAVTRIIDYWLDKFIEKDNSS